MREQKTIMTFVSPCWKPKAPDPSVVPAAKPAPSAAGQVLTTLFPSNPTSISVKFK